MKNSAIEWTDHTFNPWIGCTKVSPGCDHCYAEQRMDKRLHTVNWGPGQPRKRTSAANWREPVKWNAAAGDFVECSGCGRRGRASSWEADIRKDAPAAITCCPDRKLQPVRQRVFCASLADVFDNEVDPQWRADLFDLIEATPNLDWLLLTKRIGNVGNMLPVPFDFDKHYPNVWLGATITNQAEANRDIPKLLQVPAAKRFLSMEPLLGPVDLGEKHLTKCCDQPIERLDGDGWTSPTFVYECCQQPERAIDWVIVGGESGPNARPMHPDWARSLRNQCMAAGVPFLFKQWGEWGPDWEGAEKCGHCGETKFDAINTSGECGNCGSESWQAADKPLDTLRKVGKKAAGRLLDGRTWDEVPS